MSDERQQQQITWVGEQRLMEGYCGRAIVTGTAAAAEAGESAGDDAARPVVIVRPDGPRGPVIRIGPKPIRATPKAAVAEVAAPENEARAA